MWEFLIYFFSFSLQFHLFELQLTFLSVTCVSILSDNLIKRNFISYAQTCQSFLEPCSISGSYFTSLSTLCCSNAHSHEVAVTYPWILIFPTPPSALLYIKRAPLLRLHFPNQLPTCLQFMLVNKTHSWEIRAEEGQRSQVISTLPFLLWVPSPAVALSFPWLRFSVNGGQCD